MSNFGSTSFHLSFQALKYPKERRPGRLRCWPFQQHPHRWWWRWTKRCLHFPDIYNPSDGSAPTSAQSPSDVFSFSLRDLPDAVLGCGASRRAPPNAPPRRDEVSVATGVREGIGGAAGMPTTLEGWWFFLLLLQHLHLVLFPVFLDLRDDGRWTGIIKEKLLCYFICRVTFIWALYISRLFHLKVGQFNQQFVM